MDFRNENILTAMINGTPYEELPQSRNEELLLELKEVIESGGGGGTSDTKPLTETQVNNLLSLLNKG